VGHDRTPIGRGPQMGTHHRALAFHGVIANDTGVGTGYIGPTGSHAGPVHCGPSCAPIW